MPKIAIIPSPQELVRRTADRSDRPTDRLEEND